MTETRQTFHKSERLCSVKLISLLFEDGMVFYNSLFKVVWRYSPLPLESQVQIAFSVPKRAFKLAVTRNLIKRRLRETYRKQKNLLYDHLSAQDKQLIVIIIMRGNKIPDYSEVEKKMNDTLRQLIALTSRTDG